MRTSLLAAYVGASLLLLPGTSSADEPTPRARGKRSFDESEGFEDPRRAPLPKKHRFRLGLEAFWLRPPAACSDTTCQDFDFAPLMLSLAYQAQYAKILSTRLSFLVGPNVANTRNAMPVALGLRGQTGYQGRFFGLMAGYAYLPPLPPVVGVTDGTSDFIQPALFHIHNIGLEASVTSRVDRVAVSFILGFGMSRFRLEHYENNTIKWKPTLNLGLAFFFDGSRRGAKAQEKRKRR